MKFIAALLKRYPGQSIITLFAMLFAGIAEGFGMSMLLPLLSLCTNDGASAADPEKASALEKAVSSFFAFFHLQPSIVLLLVFFVLSIIIKVVLVLLANKRVGYTVARVATDLRLALLRAIFGSSWSYYVSQPAGTITNAYATEAARSASGYLYAMRVMAMLLNAAVYTAVALMVAWKATVITVILGSGILYVLRFMVARAKRAGRDQTNLLKSLLAFLTDVLQSIKPLKAMAREHLVEKVLEERTLSLRTALERQVFAKEALRALQEPLTTIFFTIGLYIALVVMRLPLSSVLVMVYMLAKILKALQRAQKNHQVMVIMESAYWSLQRRIELAEEQREELTGGLEPVFRRQIVLEGISFSYKERPILKDLNMKIDKGSFTALIGPSGSGKTTIVDLIAGLYFPQKGRVLIDETPLDRIDLRKWRSMIGYVPQETLLLHDTIFFNVTLGDESIGESQVIEALKRAGAWEFVSSMPEGIHSVVGERGGLISGGQRQRIMIARALVRDPKLLILDEATSALDPETERAICRTLKGLTEKVTILAISHQETILKEADIAFYLENGRVKELKDCSQYNESSI